MRLIDADALDETFSRLNDDGWQLTRGDHKRMESVLFEMPTIDAVPVVHGEWIDMQPPDADGNVQCWCSVCGAGELHAENQVVPYCWKCGAKMGGDGE